MASSAQPKFAELDQHLGGVLRRHEASPAWPTCLAVLAAADRAGYRPSLTRAWITSRARHRPEVVAAAESLQAWSRIVATYRGWAKRRRTDDGQRAVRLAIARSAVGVLLAPAPVGVSAVAALGARAVAVDVAVRALETGIDSPLTPLPALGARLSAERSTARRWARTSISVGWIRQRGVRAGSAQELRLTGRHPAEVRELLLDHADLIDALADRDADHLGAVAFRSVAHPWFAYGPLGLRGWAALALTLAGADLDRLGSPRLVRTAVRELDQLGLLKVDRTGPQLLAELDRLADRVDDDGTSPAIRARAAHAAVAAQTATRVASLQAVRAERAATIAAARTALQRGRNQQARVVAEMVCVTLPADWTGSRADHERLRVLAARKGKVVVKVDDAARVATLALATTSNRRTA